MRHWVNKNYKTIIISAFLIPIIIVAIVSISHVTRWYGISNPISWAIYLSIGIEIAAMSALAAISANMGKRVYFPFILVTFLQFLGNIYFSYNYIQLTDGYFKTWVELVSPVMQFIGIEPTDLLSHKRVLAFLAGGTLPVISLSFLNMLVKFTEKERVKDAMEDDKNEVSMDTPAILVEEITNQDMESPIIEKDDEVIVDEKKSDDVTNIEPEVEIIETPPPKPVEKEIKEEPIQVKKVSPTPRKVNIDSYSSLREEP